MRRKPSNKQLIDELRAIANFKNFGGGGQIVIKAKDIFSMDYDGFDGQTADFVRSQTRLYRDSYLDPLLDEIERRLCK